MTNNDENKTDDAPSPAANKTPLDVEKVTMHPLVLLSAADHYHRVALGTRKRAVGILLGQVLRGNVDVANSFAVPFEEDSRNPVSLKPSCGHSPVNAIETKI